MIKTNDQILTRQSKLTTILETGKQAYPHKYKQKQSIKEIKDNYEGYFESHENLQTTGRIMKIIRKGKMSFLRITDNAYDIQLVFSRDKTKDYPALKLLDRGDFIGIQGTCFVTQTKEESIYVSHIEILSKSMRPIPAPKTVVDSEGNKTVYDDFSNKELRYRKRSLDLLLNY